MLRYAKQILWFFIVFTFLYFSFITSNTDNPVRLNLSNAQEINSFFPQGWAFFTRNPREEVIRIYGVKSMELEYLNQTSSLRISDFFGISRHKRRLSSEFAEIIKKVPSKSWNEYNEDTALITSMEKLEVTDTIKNIFENNILQGEVIIYRSKRIPWAWSSSSVKMPYKLAKIYIE